MHVLVTRSGSAGRQLARRVAEAGWAASHFAPVEPGPVNDPKSLREQLELILPIDILVAPSAEALRQLDSVLGLARFAEALVVVPGPGTAAEAQRLGLERPAHPETAGDSERMLELAALAAVANKRVLIAAATGGRRVIEHELVRRGADVHRLAVYRRTPVRPSAEFLKVLRAQPAVVTLLASGGALHALQSQLPADCWQKLAVQPMIAPSLRVARLAESAGCTRVQAAQAADDQAMLAALSQVGASGVTFGVE